MTDHLSGGGLGLVESTPVTLKDRFIIPPFSVLNARDGDWQKRKRQWMSFGIKSEVGRGIKSYTTQEWVKEKGIKGNANKLTGTSIFDPVLCELAYRWFCPANGNVLDPFAGGSVRGIVAAILERNYTGVDLSEKQIEANEEQWEDISEKYKLSDDYKPNWVTGDSRNCKKIAYGKYDFIFSCPPYGNLEVYSDDPNDLSTLSHDEFIADYKKIIKRSCQMLKDNRFAFFVVGDFRDKKGIYHNFPADTISAFQEAGLKLYNEIILVTSVGSLPVRIRKQFEAGRKIGKTHQNILVFYKGDNHKDIKNIKF